MTDEEREIQYNLALLDISARLRQPGITPFSQRIDEYRIEFHIDSLLGLKDETPVETSAKGLDIDPLWIVEGIIVLFILLLVVGMLIAIHANGG
jgi:hypothetical protein